MHNSIISIHKASVIIELESLTVMGSRGVFSMTPLDSNEAIKLIENFTALKQTNNTSIKKIFFTPISDRLLEVKVYGKNKLDIKKLYHSILNYLIEKKQLKGQVVSILSKEDDLSSAKINSIKNIYSTIYSKTKPNHSNIAYSPFNIPAYFLIILFTIIFFFFYFILKKFLFS
jgi:hypothetical protein